MKDLLTSKPVIIILGILGLLLALYGALKLGFYWAQDIFVHEYQEEIAFDQFVRYETSRDISSHLKKQNYQLAKCRADLEASDKLDEVKKCLANKNCAPYIMDDVKERAPELINGTPLNFTYLPTKDHVRKCD